MISCWFDFDYLHKVLPTPGNTHTKRDTLMQTDTGTDMDMVMDTEFAKPGDHCGAHHLAAVSTQEATDQLSTWSCNREALPGSQFRHRPLNPSLACTLQQLIQISCHGENKGVI